MYSRNDPHDGDSGGIMELDDPDSGVEDVISSRRRPQWASIWRTTTPDTLAEYRKTLPTHAIDKSNQVSCTVNHLIDRNYDLHRCSYPMRSQMVPCRSERCKKQQSLLNIGPGTPPRCSCRYKFKLCLSSSTCEVFQQGDHVMNINDPPHTPVEQQLTQEMKDYILESLSGGEKTSASRLHSLLCALIDDRTMAGPAPKSTQVAHTFQGTRFQNHHNCLKNTMHADKHNTTCFHHTRTFPATTKSQRTTRIYMQSSLSAHQHNYNLTGRARPRPCCYKLSLLSNKFLLA
jgi:hypothetical protein